MKRKENTKILMVFVFIAIISINFNQTNKNVFILLKDESSNNILLPNSNLGNPEDVPDVAYIENIDFKFSKGDDFFTWVISGKLHHETDLYEYDSGPPILCVDSYFEFQKGNYDVEVNSLVMDYSASENYPRLKDLDGTTETTTTTINFENREQLGSTIITYTDVVTSLAFQKVDFTSQGNTPYFISIGENYYGNYASPQNWGSGNIIAWNNYNNSGQISNILTRRESTEAGTPTIMAAETMTLSYDFEIDLKIVSEHYNLDNIDLYVYSKSPNLGTDWRQQDPYAAKIQNSNYKIRILDKETKEIIYEDEDEEYFSAVKEIEIDSLKISNNSPEPIITELIESHHYQGENSFDLDEVYSRPEYLDYENNYGDIVVENEIDDHNKILNINDSISEDYKIANNIIDCYDNLESISFMTNSKINFDGHKNVLNASSSSTYEGDYWDIDYPSNNENIEFWIQFDQINVETIIYTRDSLNQNSLALLFRNDAKIYFAGVYTSYDYQSDIWYHIKIEFVRNGNSKLFLNQELISTGSTLNYEFQRLSLVVASDGIIFMDALGFESNGYEAYSNYYSGISVEFDENLLDDDFESGNYKNINGVLDWNSTFANYTVSGDVSLDSNIHENIVKLIDNDNGGTSSFEIEIDEEDFGSIETYVYMYNSSSELNLIFGSLGTFYIILSSDHHFKYFQFGGWVTSNFDNDKMWNSNQWIHLKIDFECSTGEYNELDQYKFNLYVNGELVGSNVEFRLNNNNIDSLKFASQTWNSVEYHHAFDSVGFSWLNYEAWSNNPNFEDYKSTNCKNAYDLQYYTDSILSEVCIDGHKEVLRTTATSDTYTYFGSPSYADASTESIEFWYRREDLTGHNNFKIFDSSWTQAINMMEFKSTGDIYCDGVDTGVNCEINTWYHFKFDFVRNDICTLYLDGKEIGTGTANDNGINIIAFHTTANSVNYIDAIGLCEFYDYKSYSNYPSHYKTNGTIEFWGNFEDSNLTLSINEHTNLHWNSTELFYWNNTMDNTDYYNEIQTISTTNYFDGNWHHWKINWTINDYFSISCDDLEIGRYNIPYVLNWDEFKFIAQNGSCVWIDAIDFSWSSGYEENRNQQLNSSEDLWCWDAFPRWESGHYQGRDFFDEEYNGNALISQINIDNRKDVLFATAIGGAKDIKLDNNDGSGYGDLSVETIEFWLKMGVSGKYMYSTLKDSNGNWGATNFIEFRVDQKIKCLGHDTGYTWSADTWYHFRFDWVQNSLCNLYLDNELIDTQIDSTNNEFDMLMFVIEEDQSIYLDALGLEYFDNYTLGSNRLENTTISKLDMQSSNLTLQTNPYSFSITNYTTENYLYNIYDLYENSLEIDLIQSNETEIIYTPPNMRESFISLANQRGDFLHWENYRIKINGTQIYENRFFREINEIVNVSIYSRFDKYITSSIYQVNRDSNYIPIEITQFSFKIYNQQEKFIYSNVTFDPNYYVSSQIWSEWIAPGEIIEYLLSENHYKINITEYETSTETIYSYTLDGDDILLITSTNTITNAISNIQNVNSTIGNQITSFSINVTNQNSAINNSVVSIDINLSNVNTTIGNLLTSQNTTINAIGSNLTTLYIYSQSQFTALNNNIDTSYTNLNSSIYLVNNSIHTSVNSLSASLININNSISGNLTLVLEQNDYLTNIYQYSMFSDFLDWNNATQFDVNYLNNSVDYFTFINEYRNESIELELRYNSVIETIQMNALDTISKYLPSSDVDYRIYSIDDEEYLDEWQEINETTIDIGFYQENVPEIPDSVIIGFQDWFYFGILALIVISVILTLYLKAQRSLGVKPRKKKKKYNDGRNFIRNDDNLLY